MTVMQEETYLTADEVATHLRVSLATVTRLLNKKKIVGFKVGDQWRISESDLRKYIEEQKQK